MQDAAAAGTRTGDEHGIYCDIPGSSKYILCLETFLCRDILTYTGINRDKPRKTGEIAFCDIHGISHDILSGFGYLEISTRYLEIPRALHMLWLSRYIL